MFLVVDKSDDELMHCIPKDNADPVRLVVPKICFLVAVAQQLSLDSFRFQPCIGSCAGLAVNPVYWK